MSAAFDAHKYLNLSTLRKSGERVNTPVWFAALSGKLYVFTAGNSGKVKRIRNFPEVRIAPCDLRGNLYGEWVAARARIVVDERQQGPAYAALRAKYGWLMWLTDMGARLTGKMASAPSSRSIVP